MYNFCSITEIAVKQKCSPIKADLISNTVVLSTSFSSFCRYPLSDLDEIKLLYKDYNKNKMYFIVVGIEIMTYSILSITIRLRHCMYIHCTFIVCSVNVHS